MKSGRLTIRRILITVTIAALVVLVRSQVAEPFVVRGESMEGALQDGDRMLVDLVSYRFRPPGRGEVVVLKHRRPGEKPQDLVKRIVALPGEMVGVASCKVYVDGILLDEPYLDEEVLAGDGCGPDQAVVRVPDGAVFVLGDHRGGSADSRFFGMVARSDLVGPVVLRFWPPGAFGPVAGS